MASHDEVSRELKLLVDRREVLVAQRTATINRLRWRVHELDPERAPLSRPGLDHAKHRELLGAWLTTLPGLVAELARDELADITRLTEAIDALAKRIGARVRACGPRALLAMPGCGELTAAKLVGETAGVTRFKSEAAFARHCRCGPCTGVVLETPRPGPHDPLGQRELGMRALSAHRGHPDRPGRPGRAPASATPEPAGGSQIPKPCARLDSEAWPASSSATSTPTSNTRTQPCQPAAA